MERLPKFIEVLDNMTRKNTAANRQRILPNFAFYKSLFLYFLNVILKQIH